MSGGRRVKRRTSRPVRRGGRLAALAMGAGALWLLLRGVELPLPEGAEVSRLLLGQELAPAAPPVTAEELLLDRLPPIYQADEPAPELSAEEPDSPEEAPPAEETLLPVSGLLEAPEEEQAEEGEEPTPQPIEVPPISVDPEALELTNSTEGIQLTLGDYLSREVPLTVSAQGPQILIMHTHGTEAYTMADGDHYTPADTARTTDENYNMIRVGEEMKSVFEDMGFTVIHDTTLYDYPSYTGSYARSLKGIESYLEQYPTISVVLDVHRDAMIAQDGTAYKVTDTIDGETVAQVMLVVGTNDGGLDHPGWEDNVTLAAHIQARMLAIDSGFPRPVNLRSQRFNQHMTQGSLLVEVGTSGNTLQEALAGARLFAQAAGEEYLRCMEEP